MLEDVLSIVHEDRGEEIMKVPHVIEDRPDQSLDVSDQELELNADIIDVLSTKEEEDDSEFMQVSTTFCQMDDPVQQFPPRARQQGQCTEVEDFGWRRMCF